MLFGSIASASGECYVFSLFTENDPSSKITTTSSDIITSNIDQSDKGWVWYDAGAGYYSGDFMFQFSLNISDADLGGYIGGYIILSNTLPGTTNDWLVKIINSSTGNFDTLGLWFYDDPDNKVQARIFQRRAEASTAAYSANYEFGLLSAVANVEYYFNFKYDADEGTYGTCYLDIFSDSAMTDQLGEISYALTEANSWRYFVPFMGGGSTVSGYYSSADLGTTCYYTSFGATAQTDNATDIYYDSYLEESFATLNGEVVNDGGEACTASFYYKKTTDSEWSWAGGDATTYSTGQSFSFDVIGLEPDYTYEYFARIHNSMGNFDGDTVEFSTALPSGVAPVMATYNYPLDKGTDNVTLYGAVVTDGGANVTGYFQYRQTGTATWYDSDNETDLTTGDNYHITVGSIPERTEYQFRAIGVNEYGSDTGSIGTFEIINATEPSITVSLDEVGHNYAYITGNVTDDGGDTCNSRIYYRKVGASSWQVPQVSQLNTGESMTIYASGLTPSAQYEYYFTVSNDWGTETTDTYTFYTSQATYTPTMDFYGYGYLTQTSAYFEPEVVDDGGSSVTIWLEYRALGSETWISNASQYTNYGVTEGNYVQQIISNLQYGQTYYVRAAGQNENGTSYSDVIEYPHISPTDTTTPEATDETAGLLAWLTRVGLNNTGGKLLLVIAGMIFVFFVAIFAPGPMYREFAKFTVPVGAMLAVLVLVYGMVKGWVPTVLTVSLLVLAAAYPGILIIRMFQGGKSRGYEG